MKARVFTVVMGMVVALVAFGRRADFDLDGGMVKRPNTQRGRIVFVNCQSRIDQSVIEHGAAALEDELCFQIDVERGCFTLKSPRLPAPATLFVVDDNGLPTLLSAPENGWAVVNVAPLATSDESVFRSRVRKEISRGFALLCGAFMSQYANPLVGCVTNAEQLDAIDKDELPFDSLMRIPIYLKGYGLAPYDPTSYLDACQQGFAPVPTNAVQRAIWEKVHEMPPAPIKIKPDTTKVGE